MAARATASDVKALLGTSLADATVEIFIDIANRLVNKYLSSASCHDETSLKDVETFLSAHFVSLRVNKATAKKISSAGKNFRAPGVLLKGLEFSEWGQQAIFADCSGILARLGKRAVQTVVAGGGGDFETFEDGS